jgi:elongation factor P--(R)-beta-lysine ligase
MSRISPWWMPDRHADRRPFLTARGRIKAAFRNWFTAQGFTEVEPACLQMSPGNEAHLHALSTDIVGPDLSRRRRYLHTSPEFAMKKLLAAGEEKIFAFTHCFRNREHGPLHATEFTMLEWYRTGSPYEQVMDDAAELLRLACATTGQHLISWRGAVAVPKGAADRLTVAQAFQRHAGIDLLRTMSIATSETFLAPAATPNSPSPSRGGDRGGGLPPSATGFGPPPTPPRQGEGRCPIPSVVQVDRDALAEQVRAQGITVRDDDSWSDLFARVLAASIEPKLGLGQPQLMFEYPTIEAALARPAPNDPRVAERFELYCCGVELANGFGELTDPVLQRANLEAQMALKEKIYGERYPIDEDFLAALAHMPPASGCALGFDRLVMLAAGATHIDQVLWTPDS